MLNMVKVPKHEVNVCKNAPFKTKAQVSVSPERNMYECISEVAICNKEVKSDHSGSANSWFQLALRCSNPIILACKCSLDFYIYLLLKYKIYLDLL